ncbi:MAG: hypothetical protein M3Q65_04140 [Chloroflexota bacterium]|nr:hypothetical protein [Chloroflexota bacterium]
MREWTRKRRTVALLLAAVLAIGLLGLIVILRDNRAALAWKQGPAVALPATIAEVEAIRLTMEDQPGLLAYSLQCLQPAGDRTIEVTARDPRGTRTTTFPRACTAPGQPAGRGTMLRLDELQTGETIEITLSVQSTGGRSPTGLAAVSRVYTMGTDGRLRLGLGSVWR